MQFINSWELVVRSFALEWRNADKVWWRKTRPYGGDAEDEVESQKSIGRADTFHAFHRYWVVMAAYNHVTE